MDLHVTAGTKHHKLKAPLSWIDENVAFPTFQDLGYQNAANLWGFFIPM